MKYCYYILLIVCLCSCKDASEQVVTKLESNTIGNYEIIPSKIDAGEAISIKGNIENNDSSTDEITLHVKHALYSKSYSTKNTNGYFEIEIPAIDNQIAGVVNTSLVYQEEIIGAEKYFIKPLYAINKMQSFNGPKDLYAGDDDASMNVSIPHDKYDNPLLPPANVNFSKSFEGQIQSEEQKTIEHLVAYQITNSKLTKGKYLIGSKSSDGFSQEQELIIGAAMPEQFNIELISFHPFADARQFIAFKTTVLKDQFDNIIADGTLINFVVEENESVVGVYQAFTIGGVAIVYIENPSKEISWTIYASLHDQIKSNRVLLSFSKNVNDFDLTWDAQKQTLSIGPVIGILGQLVPDGTEVFISNTAKGLKDYVYLEEGKYNYQLDFDWKEIKPTQLTVLIGGHEKTIQLD